MNIKRFSTLTFILVSLMPLQASAGFWSLDSFRNLGNSLFESARTTISNSSSSFKKAAMITVGALGLTSLGLYAGLKYNAKVKANDKARAEKTAKDEQERLWQQFEQEEKVREANHAKRKQDEIEAAKRKADEDAARNRKEEEERAIAQRIEQEKKQKEDEQAEQRRLEEQKRLAEEKRKQDEAEAAQRKAKADEDAARNRKEEEDRVIAQRIEKEKKQKDDQRRLEDQKRLEEERVRKEKELSEKQEQERQRALEKKRAHDEQERIDNELYELDNRSMPYLAIIISAIRDNDLTSCINNYAEWNKQMQAYIATFKQSNHETARDRAEVWGSFNKQLNEKYGRLVEAGEAVIKKINQVAVFGEDQDKQKSEQAELQDCVNLSRYLYLKAVENGDQFTEGTMVVHDPTLKLFKFLQTFNPYTRKASHYHEYGNTYYGIDIPYELREKPEFALPNGKHHILFGELKDGYIFIKFEDHGTKTWTDFGLHGVGFARTLYREKLGGKNDQPGWRKERVSHDMKKHWDALMNEAARNHSDDTLTIEDQRADGTTYGIHKMIPLFNAYAQNLVAMKGVVKPTEVAALDAMIHEYAYEDQEADRFGNSTVELFKAKGIGMTYDDQQRELQLKAQKDRNIRKSFEVILTGQELGIQ